MVQTNHGSGMSNGHRCISWLDNLINGVSSIVLHPISPLSTVDFRFGCLFTHKPYCCVDTTGNKLEEHELYNQSGSPKEPISHGYFTSLREFPNLIKEGLGLSGFQQNPPIKSWPAPDKKALLDRVIELHTDFKNYIKTKPPNIFLASQLILCTVVLIYVIFKDAKKVVGYVKIIQKKNGS